MPRSKKYEVESDSDSESSMSCSPSGKGIKNIAKKATKEYGKVLKHLTSHIADVKEPVDPKDFKQAKEMINNIKEVKGGRIIPKSDVIVGPSISMGKGLLDNLTVKDLEHLDKIIKEFSIKKKDEVRKLKGIKEGTIKRVKKEVEALKEAKPDKRFTRKGTGLPKKGSEEAKEFMAKLRSMRKSKK